MKGLPGKLMMAGIVLSCGLIVHAEPSAQRGPAKRGATAVTRTRQLHRAASAERYRRETLPPSFPTQ